MPPTKKRILSTAAAVVAAGSLLAVPAVAQADSTPSGADAPHGIESFQSDNGLKQTGELNPRTAQELARASDAERRATFRTAADLDEEQMANARTVIGVGKGAGISEQGQVIALMTAMQESTFINYLEPVDHDSLGVFQQRPSTGWGTPAQITDVPTSSKSFYGVSDVTPNPGLLQITGWESMAPGDAAQAVQRSAYPDRYAQWEQFARDLLAQEGPGVDPIP